MRISIVVAAAENNVIGKDGRLLWHLPNDMKFFKNTTWGMPVIMGRKTYDSIKKPLQGRTNIVISRNDNWNMQGVLRAENLQDAIRLAEDTDAREAYVIGGGEIYVQALPIAHRIYLTRIKAVPEGDAFFPALKEGEWKLLSQLPFEPDEKHVYSYCFEVWERS